MARLNITVVVPVPQTKPLPENPGDPYLTPWATHLQGANDEFDDAAWGVSEMRRMSPAQVTKHIYRPDHLPEADDGILRQED